MPDDGRSAVRGHVSDASVVICAYTFDRLTDTIASAESALAQRPAPARVIVVVDHDRELQECLRAELPDAVDVVPNVGPQGLSGARNSGIARATGRIVAFLDDDATALPGWLASLRRAFDDPSVLIAGGHAEPAWDGGAPAWFPDEFRWVVGCSYAGMTRQGTVRNPLGCNMAVRSDLFVAIGGFDPAVGRSATLPLGGDETELSIRARRLRPDGRVVMVDDALVTHRVPRGRQKVRYFVRRCYYEGISKAALRRLEGGAALESERRYATSTLPAAIGRNLLAAAKGDRSWARVRQAAAIMVGLAATTAGFIAGSIQAIGRGGTSRWSSEARDVAVGTFAGDSEPRPNVVAMPMGPRTRRPRVVQATPVVVRPPAERPDADARSASELLDDGQDMELVPVPASGVEAAALRETAAPFAARQRRTGR